MKSVDAREDRHRDFESCSSRLEGPGRAGSGRWGSASVSVGGRGLRLAVDLCNVRNVDSYSVCKVLADLVSDACSRDMGLKCGSHCGHGLVGERCRPVIARMSRTPS